MTKTTINISLYLPSYHRLHTQGLNIGFIKFEVWLRPCWRKMNYHLRICQTCTPEFPFLSKVYAWISFIFLHYTSMLWEISKEYYATYICPGVLVSIHVEYWDDVPLKRVYNSLHSRARPTLVVWQKLYKTNTKLHISFLSVSTSASFVLVKLFPLSSALFNYLRRIL